MFDASVTAYLETQHFQMDAMLDDLRQAISAGALFEARRAFVMMTRTLFRHMDAEERVLFPAAERAGLVHKDITALMCLEHRRIRKRIMATSKSLAASDLDSTMEDVGAIIAMLELHNEKEESLVCPVVDDALASTAVRTALLERMEALSRDSLLA